MSETVPTIDTSNITKAIDVISQIILGKENSIRLAIACLIARGHLLIEDTPGVGKTTLSHTLAKALGLDYQRIQFTSDLLPADILGVSVYNRDTSKFDFHQGPVFTNVILADEINRATPRTQSALLEAMAEYQVTVEGETRDLPKPFFVIATQNPSNQIGTFPLPESQLDRFLMRIELGYPDNIAERELLKGKNRKDLLEEVQAVLTAEELIKLQKQLDSVHVSDALLDYVQSLMEFSRSSGNYIHGLSPRAGIAILSAAKAWALISSHQHVLPEDVQMVLPSVIGHRLNFLYDVTDKQALQPAEHLIRNVPIP
ncbi:MAG: MoxR family ATPase [Proteobacteria bacterium]|nr:MoxR family ATPase [Pseudomonadota bacterium]NOG60580.1 MoxR family ATPase [Pseudomonadota bacterium]